MGRWVSAVSSTSAVMFALGKLNTAPAFSGSTVLSFPAGSPLDLCLDGSFRFDSRTPLIPNLTSHPTVPSRGTHWGGVSLEMWEVDVEPSRITSGLSSHLRISTISCSSRIPSVFCKRKVSF